MLEVNFYEQVDDELLKFAVIISKTDGKWVFCKHKERDTYEVPGGHREPGETILETAQRELREETGAIDFHLKPVCAYSVKGKTRVNETIDDETFGMLFVADIISFEKELHSEIEQIIITDHLVDNWTYPLIQPKLIEEAEKRGCLHHLNDEMYECTKICDNIWQIAEDEGVYCTLVKGNELAVLIDTGYGKRNLRAFIEKHVTTPYIVINSHGHPDHIGGNHWFDAVYALKEEWDVIQYFEENRQRTYELKEIQIGQKISLGDINMIVISLAGHTKGSVGFLIPEEKLLIAGDALNEGLWLFNYGSLSMNDLYETIKKTLELDFNEYICGHSDQKYSKEKLISHIRNIEQLSIDENTKQDTIGFETYCSKYEDFHGKSEIVFTIDKV